MRYFGGKSRTAKKLSTFIKQYRKPNQTYIEPFVGGAWMLKEMADDTGKNIASDLNFYLIEMYKALQKGWLPDINIDDQYYHDAKKGKYGDAMKAFVGIGCSFSGKWFGGRAKDNTTRNYASNAKNSLLKKLPAIQRTDFYHEPYYKYNTMLTDCLFYCDPPYADTTRYDGVDEAFDYDRFWEWCRQIAKNNTIFISEYKAPSDFKCVLEIPVKTDMKMKDGTKDHRIEKLFTIP